MKPRVLVIAAIAIAALVSTAQQPEGSIGSAQRSPQQIVVDERAKFAAMSEPADLVKFLRGVIGALNAEGVAGGPFGLLIKTAGSNCLGYSCDVICSGQGAQQRQWDVLIDGGGASLPTWHEVGPGQTVRPCELAATAPPPGCDWPDQRVEVAQLRNEGAAKDRRIAELEANDLRHFEAVVELTSRALNAEAERDDARRERDACLARPEPRAEVRPSWLRRVGASCRIAQ